MNIAYAVVVYLFAGVLWSSLSTTLRIHAKQPTSTQRATWVMLLWPLDLGVVVVILAGVIIALPLIGLGKLAHKLGGGK